MASEATARNTRTTHCPNWCLTLFFGRLKHISVCGVRSAIALSFRRGTIRYPPPPLLVQGLANDQKLTERLVLPWPQISDGRHSPESLRGLCGGAWRRLVEQQEAEC